MRYAQAGDHVVVCRYTSPTPLVHLVVESETSGDLGYTACYRSVRTDRPQPEVCDKIVDAPITCLECVANTRRLSV
jgi:hypothetical protein